MTHELMGRQNGAAIRAFRKKEELEVAQLARYVGLHPQSLRNIENGRRPAGDDVMKDLARVLGVPIEAITRDGTDGGLGGDAPEQDAPEQDAPEPRDEAA
jgi:transcriptional regulator with XRE-family HTH domain